MNNIEVSDTYEMLDIDVDIDINLVPSVDDVEKIEPLDYNEFSSLRDNIISATDGGVDSFTAFNPGEDYTGKIGGFDLTVYAQYRTMWISYKTKGLKYVIMMKLDDLKTACVWSYEKQKGLEGLSQDDFMRKTGIIQPKIDNKPDDMLIYYKKLSNKEVNNIVKKANKLFVK